jgi:DNA-binding FrmR family transcriptional regulator
VLLDILIEAGALARMVREGESPETIAAQAAAVDRSTARADRVIETLGLSECARLTVGPRIDSGP